MKERRAGLERQISRSSSPDLTTEDDRLRLGSTEPLVGRGHAEGGAMSREIQKTLSEQQSGKMRGRPWMAGLRCDPVRREGKAA
jgi:hypothetical protein